MATKKEHAHPDKLKSYEILLGAFPDVEMKGDTMKYTSLNGNMYSFLSKEGKLALRLPEVDLEKFLSKYKTKLFEAYGTVLKEYATVPDRLLKDPKELKKYFQISYEYVQTLKPKPTTKKKK